MKAFSVLLLTLAVSIAAPAPVRSEIRLGVGVTPKHFPLQTEDDVREAFKTASKIGSRAVLIFQWNDSYLQDARYMLAWTRKVGLTSVVALSPTRLDNARGVLEMPAAVRTAAGDSASFSNPIVRQAFRKAAVALARLRPDFLCLATEINFLAFQDIQEYIAFARSYKRAYRAVKRVSPRTKVFVSFQWDWLRILDEREPTLEQVRRHSQLIDLFRPRLDIIAITSYPAPFYESPDLLPSNYYSSLQQHLKRHDEVMLSEVGWPSGGSGSEAEQAGFLSRLPSLLQRIPVRSIDWALLHDVPAGTFDDNVRTVGLFEVSGKSKPGLRAFRALRHSLRR